MYANIPWISEYGKARAIKAGMTLEFRSYCSKSCDELWARQHPTRRLNSSICNAARHNIPAKRQPGAVEEELTRKQEWARSAFRLTVSCFGLSGRTGLLFVWGGTDSIWLSVLLLLRITPTFHYRTNPFVCFFAQQILMRALLRKRWHVSQFCIHIFSNQTFKS